MHSLLIQEYHCYSLINLPIATIFLNYVGVSKTTLSVFDRTSKLVSLTTGARDAAAADAAVGYLIYNTTTSKVQVCTSIGPVVWVDLN